MLGKLPNAMLAMGLTACLAVCPYSCMLSPRLVGESRAEAGSGCGCSCCPSTPSQTPPWQSNQRRQLPKEPCCCTCVCKGALIKYPGLIDGDDLGPAGRCAVSFVLVYSPDSTAASAAWEYPDPPPPRTVSGRKIRALIASLLL